MNNEKCVIELNHLFSDRKDPGNMENRGKTDNRLRTWFRRATRSETPGGEGSLKQWKSVPTNFAAQVETEELRPH